MDQTLLGLVLLSACAALCLGSLGGGKLQCDERLRENVMFSIDRARVRYSPSALHCQVMCTQDPSCVVFAFHEPSRKSRKYFCYMWKKGNLKIENSTGITSGYNLRGCSQLKKPCFNETYEGVKFGPRPYVTVGADDLDHCREKCRQDEHCEFYTYYPKISWCQLKFTMPIPVPSFQPSDNIFSGFSHNLDTDFGSGEKCPTKLYKDKQLKSGRYCKISSAISALHCQALCNINPRCRVFMYFRGHTNGHNCHMSCHRRASSERVTERRGVTSGRAQRGCKVDFSWIDDVVEGGLYGPDLSVNIKPDLESCKESCNDNPNCLYYLYISMDHPKVKKRGECHLKSVLTLPRPSVFPKAGAISGFVQNC